MVWKDNPVTCDHYIHLGPVLRMIQLETPLVGGRQFTNLSSSTNIHCGDCQARRTIFIGLDPSGVGLSPQGLGYICHLNGL